MNINATLIGQTVAFFIFVWFCMKYVWPPILAAMAETDPEYQVEVDTGASRSVVGGQTIRLVDDVFSRTCQAINDVRETVRVLAARLIGEMRGVSQGYLEQTLDKKLMSNMRTKRNAHERMAGLVSSGEWSSGSR